LTLQGFPLRIALPEDSAGENATQFCAPDADDETSRVVINPFLTLTNVTEG